MPPSSSATIPDLNFGLAGVLRTLERAGLGVTPIAVAMRQGRWLARLPDGRMAWFPRNPAGRTVLRRERRILRLIEARCAFAAPRAIREYPGGWELREPVRGVTDPTALYHRLQADRALAARLGGEIGAVLADQHSHVTAADVEGWMPTVVGWPMPDAWLWRRLPGVARDGRLLTRMRAALKAHRGPGAPPPDRVLVHGDLGLHNIAIDPATGGLAGVFDYGGAAFADRHEDFRYLLFDVGDETMLDAALAVYQPATGVTLDRSRIRLANAACAIGFLAFRDGHGPDEPWCGRTLAQDLAWTELALTRAGF